MSKHDFTMPVKLCKWGTCKGDSRKNDPDIKFFPMPKPCKYFRDQEEVKIKHDVDQCQKWVNACSVEGFYLKSINQNFYLCSKHFANDQPTALNPIPLSAASFKVSFTNIKLTVECMHLFIYLDLNSQARNTKILKILK